MGLPMAINLANAGYTVNGYDVEREITHAIPTSMYVCSSLESSTNNASLVFMMLPNGAIVLEVLKQILAMSSPPSTIVDCSTIDIEDARQAHALAKQANVAFLDAPVSGGIKGAAAGTLTGMIGGSSSALAAIEPCLSALFKNTVHCGDAGAGQAAKICNNMLLATSMIGASEAFNLGASLGLDQQILFNILSTSTGSCWSVNQYCPIPGIGPQSPADNHYQPGFSGHMMLKDMKLTQNAADSVNVATPLGAHALELYQRYVDQGAGEDDFSGIVRFLQILERQA